MGLVTTGGICITRPSRPGQRKERLGPFKTFFTSVRLHTPMNPINRKYGDQARRITPARRRAGEGADTVDPDFVGSAWGFQKRSRITSAEMAASELRMSVRYGPMKFDVANWTLANASPQTAAAGQTRRNPERPFITKTR